MKLWSILTLFVFLNFTVLPGVAVILGCDMPQTNVMMSEEENHASSFVVYEKTLPRTLSVFDYVKFCKSDFREKPFVIKNESPHRSPFISIFSPPPEV